MRDLSGISCIAYCRVSTERQAGEKQTSLADQQGAITALATKLGVVVGCSFIDAGASGGSAEGRPEFMAMIHTCEASSRKLRAQGLILALNDSRFGRFDDPEESAYWRVLLSKLGWTVRFAENDDSDNRTVRTLMRAIGSAQASEYRHAIKANAKRGARGTAEQGYWTREAPYGYRRKVVFPPGRERILEIGELKAPNEKVSLYPYDVEAAVVRKIFENFANGEHSLGTLARWLAYEVPGRVWSRRHVQSLLKNETYTGDIAGGRRANVGHGQFRRTQPDEWYGKRGAHPALVSRETFASVQARLADNRKRGRGCKAVYVLSGLVTCSECGSLYVGGGIGGRVKPSPEVPDGISWFYRCSSSSNEPPYRKECRGHMGTIARHKLERAVIDTLAQELSRPAMMQRIRAEIDHALGARFKSSAGQLEDVRSSIASVERKRERLVALVADGTLMQEEASAQLASVRTELGALRNREEALTFEEKRQHIDPGVREAVTRLALDFPRVARASSGPVLRELIRPWLARATFDKNTRILTLDIRRVPAVGPFLVNNLPGQNGQEKRRGIVTRTVDLSTPQFLAKHERRGASGG